MASSAFIPNFFLTRCEDELFLHPGQPVAMPKAQRKRICVVGNDVTALTTAWVLLDAGYDVTILAEPERIAPNDTVDLWQWLPTYYGNYEHATDMTTEKLKIWSQTSYRVFDKIHKMIPPSKSYDHGIRMRTTNFLFSQELENLKDKTHLEKWENIAISEIKNVRRDPTVINSLPILNKASFMDSYHYLGPAVNTTIYLGWLQLIVACKGAAFETRILAGRVVDQEEYLLKHYKADIIVNTLGGTITESRRGTFLQVVNDGSRFPKITETLVVARYDANGQALDPLFMVPRNDEILMLGGHLQTHEHHITLEHPDVKRMRNCFNDMVQGLDKAEPYSKAPLVHCLSACRDTARVERESRARADGSSSRIVHSTVAGPPDLSLSFGHASSVLDLVQNIENEMYYAEMPGCGARL